MAIQRATGAKAVTPPPSTTANNTAPANPDKTVGVHTGAEARERALREAEETRIARENRAMGYDFSAYNGLRFRLADPNKVQRENDRSIPRFAADVIILDKSWDDLYYVYEHEIYDDAAKSLNYYLCSHETHNCPVCPTIRPVRGGDPVERGAYIMHTTILDVTEETDYSGNTHEYRKRPMAISSQLHPEFIKLMGEAMQKHGTIRGMMLLMERDSNFNSKIGRPVVRPDGAMYVMVTEEDLINEFGHEEERSDDGNNTLIKPANFDIMPYNYGHIFPKLDHAYVKKLQEKFGASNNGPAAANNSVGRNWREEGGSTNAAAPPPRVRSRSSYTASAPPDAPRTQTAQQQEAVEEQQQKAPPPRVRSRAQAPSEQSAAAPSRQRVRPVTEGTAAAKGSDINAEIPWKD